MTQTQTTEPYVWLDHFQLRENLPALLDLAINPNVPEDADQCRAIWHTPACGRKQRFPANWILGIPAYVARQTFEVATLTSACGFCQNCTVRKITA